MDVYSAEGVWWRPEASQHRVPGTLTSDEDGVELVVYGPLQPPIPSKVGVVQSKGPTRVAGPRGLLKPLGRGDQPRLDGGRGMVAHGEAAALAERLLAEAITAQGVEPGTLNVHADRGTSMTSKPVTLLLADLGVTKSHARPHVPDDNPYSESQLKTLKHHPRSRSGSARSRTPERSARASSAGITRSTTTPASVC